MRKILIAICIICLYALNCEAKVVLPSLIQDNMVLQQQSNVTLWGKATPNKEVLITPSWLNKSIKTKSDSNGKWQVKVATSHAGGPYTITFNDGAELRISNVLLGEVWLCSGQSNMELPMKGFASQPVLGSQNVIVTAKESVPIRLFTVKRTFSKEQQEDCEGSWLLNNSQSVSDFSATGYYFGQYIQNVLNVPVGLICNAVGGSNVQAWMSDDVLKLFPDVDMSLLTKDLSKQADNLHIITPTLLYNGMMNPLKNVTFKGVIWYQGEANKRNCKEYASLFPRFVEMLRDLYSTPNMPFYYAQIAPFSEYNSPYSNTVLMRETQAAMLPKIHDAGMAVLTDVGEEFCIHPPFKCEAGERLAYLALDKTYHCKGFVSQSPVYDSMKIEGNKVSLHFTNATQGMTDYYKGLNLFEVAGADKKFYPAKAKVTRDYYQVIVWCDSVTTPVAVRYAFKNYVKGDLFNTSGLPASSFRTDDWSIPNVDPRKQLRGKK